MTNQKPIEPLPSREFITGTWRAAFENESSENTALQTFAAEMAQWGFNQHAALNEAELQKARDEQLEACCDWLDGYESEGWAAEQMRNACRLKPKSQAEEALKAIGAPTKIGEARVIEHHAHELIRAALERLRELEGNQ